LKFLNEYFYKSSLTFCPNMSIIVWLSLARINIHFQNMHILWCIWKMDKTLIKLDALDHASFDIISYKFACHLHHTLFTRDKYFLKFGHIGKFKHFSKIPTMYLSVVFSFIMSYIKMSTSLKLCNKRFLLQNGIF
jgi:hypothetical protein